MASSKMITWDDFSGGYFVGARDNQQPMNTWRGIDITVAPQTGYLVRRGAYTASVSNTSAYSDTIKSGTWPGQLQASAVTVFEVKDPAATVDVIPAFAFCTLGGTVAAAVCNFVVLRAYSGVLTALNFTLPAGKIPTSNILVVPTGSEANVFVSVAKPDGTLPELCMIATGTGTNVNVSIPQPFSCIELFGDYMVGASVTSNRVYFSNLYSTYSDWTTSGVGGFFEVGDGSYPLAVIVQRDSLWIGKRNGWWVLNGVLESADNVTLRQVAVTTGPPGVSPISISLGLPYPYRHAGMRELAAMTDMGILYPGGVSGAQQTLSAVFPGDIGPGGRGGIMGLSGIDSQMVLAAPAEVMEAGSDYTGIIPACDSTVVVEHYAGRPNTNLPMPLDEFEAGAWVLKGRVWERRTPPVTAVGVQGWCRDMRSLDGIPRQNLIYATRTITGGTETFYAWSGPVYTEYPDSSIPCQVKLASWASDSPIKVKRMIVVIDYGPLDLSSSSANFVLASVRARVTSPGAINNGLGIEASSWQELQVPITDGPYTERRTAVLAFEPTDLSETVEVQPELIFSACRIRRVTMEVG